MARSFAGSSAGGAAQTAIKPHWLIALYFTAGTVRLSSRGAYTYSSNVYAAAGVNVTSDQLRIFDDATQYSPLFVAQRSPVSVDIFEAFGNDPLSNTDFDHVFSGEIGQRDIGDWINCQLRTITLRPEPHIYIQQPTFNWLPARDTVILTPTGTYQLPAPPVAQVVARPPAQFNSPTIPGWIPPVAPAGSINTQPELDEIQANFAAEGTIVPVHYGPFQFGGLPFAIAHASGTWTVGFVVGLGQIEAIDQVWINGAAPVSGVVVNSYTGTTGQTADALLVAAISGYADTLVHNDDGVNVGIAYVVIQYTNTHYPAFPSVIIEGRGRRVFDPETSTTAYSASPALALRDFVTSIMGESCSGTSTTTLKGACAATVSGEPRRLVGITIDRAQSPEQWLEVLRTYASCFAWKRADTWHFLADRPGSVVKTITASEILGKSLRISLPDQSQTPTVVRCQFTDTSQDVWKNQEVSSEDSGVSTGATPRINSAIRLPGVHRQSQATREVIERRKKLAKSLRIEFEAFADHADLEFGDIIEMSGFTRLPGLPKFRIVAPPRRTDRGNVRIVATEYDVTVYDDSAPAATPPGGVKVIGTTTLPANGADGISVYASLSANNLFTQAPNGGAWSHTTADVTFTWKRGATTLATRVVRATLDTGTLLITLSAISNTGEATTFTPPSASINPVATVAHTASGVTHALGFGSAQGGSQGSAGSSPTANFGGQWGAVGDLVLKPNQATGGADNGEILLEGAAGAGWVVYLGSTLTPRTGSRVTLNTPWEGDVSAELGPRDNTFYVMEMASTASSRWGGSFQAISAVTVTFEPTTRTWKAYPDTTGGAVTFTPLTTDIIVGIGYKISTSGGIDRLTSMMTAFKLTPSTIALFLDLLSVTGALIADATIGNAKIADLAANKITAGTINAVLALANELQIATGGKVYMGKSTFATALAGFFLGDDSGTAKFIVGNADGTKKISWDGTNFSINGQLIAWGSNISGKPADTDILNTSVIVFRHSPLLAWLSFGTTSSDYSPTTSTQTVDIDVYDGTGTLVATRTLTGTVTFSNGQISVPSDTVSGITTSTSGNNTTNVTVTITYSGKTSRMGWITSTSDTGGVGK